MKTCANESCKACNEAHGDRGCWKPARELKAQSHARVARSATYDGTRPTDTVYYGYSKESLEWLPGLVLLGRRVLGYTVFNIRFTLVGRKKIRRSR